MNIAQFAILFCTKNVRSCICGDFKNKRTKFPRGPSFRLLFPFSFGSHHDLHKSEDATFLGLTVVHALKHVGHDAIDI